jgi:hypothetical protein
MHDCPIPLDIQLRDAIDFWSKADETVVTDTEISSDVLGLLIELRDTDAHKDKRLAELEELSGVNSAQIKLLGDWLNARGKRIAGLVERTVGKWLSAALDDPNVCDEMKADINEFFAEVSVLAQQPEKEQGS